MSQKNCDKEYKKHLEKWFQYVMDNPDIHEKCEPISGFAKSIYSKLKNCRDDENWSLTIDPPWPIPIEHDENFCDHSAYLLVGGKIGVRNCSFIFYSFSLCIVLDDRIARRFHFDIDTENGAAMKPECHMQYGGKAIHELNSYPSLNYSLDEWIEKPRFVFPPIDMVLLLDSILAQISTPLGQKFTQEPRWKSLVKESEKLRLRAYYSQIQQYLDNIDNNRQTLFERLCS